MILYSILRLVHVVTAGRAGVNKHSHCADNKCMSRVLIILNLSFMCTSICHQCSGAGHTDARDGLSLDARRTRGGVTWWESAEADRPRRHHLLTQSTGGRTKVMRSFWESSLPTIWIPNLINAAVSYRPLKWSDVINTLPSCTINTRLKHKTPATGRH